MPKYENAVVYKLCCDDPDITDIYVGSTCNFKVRKNQHKSACCNQNDEKHKRYLYRFIRERGGWDNWSMILIKKYPDVVDNYELHKKERKWMKKLKASLNKTIPTRTNNEWIMEHKERFQNYHKKYRQDNKDKIKEFMKIYRIKNKEKIKKYNLDNRERLNALQLVKTQCECGCWVSRKSLKRHRQSKKHINLTNQ